MKVYLEFVFMVNYLLDFMILFGTKRLLKISSSNYRLLLSSLVGTFTTLILFIDISNELLLIFKIFISSFMIIISFGFYNFFRNIFYFYIISIIVGGFIYLFDVNYNYYFYMIFVVLSGLFIINIFVKEFINFRINYKDKYNVIISYDNKKYRLEGFIDTGNRLVSPISKKSIILVNLKFNYKNIIYIPYKALNCTGILPCIKPDAVLINDKVINNCLIGISNDKFNINGFNCILPNRIKEEL